MANHCHVQTDLLLRTQRNRARTVQLHRLPPEPRRTHPLQNLQSGRNLQRPLLSLTTARKMIIARKTSPSPVTAVETAMHHTSRELLSRSPTTKSMTWPRRWRPSSHWHAILCVQLSACCRLCTQNTPFSQRCDKVSCSGSPRLPQTMCRHKRNLIGCHCTSPRHATVTKIDLCKPLTQRCHYSTTTYSISRQLPEQLPWQPSTAGFGYRLW